MLTNIQVRALDEIEFLRKDCHSLLDDMFAVCTLDANGHYPSAFRIVATPFLYAVWERCFRTAFGIMGSVIRQQAETPSGMDFSQATLWLQRESFVTSFLDKVRSKPIEGDDLPSRKVIKSSAYKSLAEFFSNLINWHSQKLNNAPPDNELVMTFSNVNGAVLDANADAFGLSNLPEYQNFRAQIGRLDDLVGRRNDIGHGTLARPPGPREFDELRTLVSELLVSRFCEVVQTWIFYR